MSLYDLPKDKRIQLVKKIEQEIQENLEKYTTFSLQKYFSDEDTHIRKTAYLTVGKIYFTHQNLKQEIFNILEKLFQNDDEKIRQTVVNALGEIGKKEAEPALKVFEQAILDNHHIVRNAVIGSLKKMGEKNPKPVLAFCKKFLHHPNPEIRRQVIHGVELRGRTHPEEVIPFLQEVQFEQNRRVRNIIIHVLGQISYKKDCLEQVIKSLKQWENKELVKDTLAEILETHKTYEKFSAEGYTEAKKYIEKNFH